MSEITVTSTTDTPESVAEALGVEADEVESEVPATDTESENEGEESESGSASGADENEEQESEDDDESGHSDDEGEGEGEDEPKPQSKKKGGWQKKIDKLTRSNYEKDREIAALKASRLDAPPQKKEEPPAPKPKAIEFPTAPDPAAKNTDGTPKYQTYGEFLTALTTWTKEMATLATTEAQKTALAEAETKVSAMRKDFETRQIQQETIKRLNDDYQSRRKEAIPLYDDWDTVVDKNDSLVITPTMQVLMHTHPQGAHLAYWYGKNPEEVERIAALHPEAQKLELGYVLKTLKPPVKSDKNGGPKENVGERKKSNAPKPLKTKAGGKSSVAVKDYRYYENLSYDEFKKARESGALK